MCDSSPADEPNHSILRIPYHDVLWYDNVILYSTLFHHIPPYSTIFDMRDSMDFPPFGYLIVPLQEAHPIFPTFFRFLDFFCFTVCAWVPRSGIRICCQMKMVSWFCLLFHKDSADSLFHNFSLPGNHRVSNQFYSILPDSASHVSAANCTPCYSFTFHAPVLPLSSSFVVSINFSQYPDFTVHILKLSHLSAETWETRDLEKHSETNRVCALAATKQCTMRPEIHGNSLSPGDLAPKNTSRALCPHHHPQPLALQLVSVAEAKRCLCRGFGIYGR